MPLILDDNSAQYQIKAYKPGVIQINETQYTKSIIVMANHLIENWAPQDILALKAEDLSHLLTLKPAILLIGTGEKCHFPEKSIYEAFTEKGIGVEIMDTRAACLTYNALTSENRNVIAALLLR